MAPTQLAESSSLPIGAVRPTQLSLDASELASVLEWVDPERPAYDPLPVFEHEDEWHLAGRDVSAERFETAWNDRCHDAAERLEE